MQPRTDAHQVVLYAERQTGFMPGVSWYPLNSGLRVGLVNSTPTLDVRMPASPSQHISLALMLEANGHYQMRGSPRICPFERDNCYLSCAWERFSGADYFPAHCTLKLAIIQYQLEWLDVIKPLLRKTREHYEVYRHPSSEAYVARMRMSPMLKQIAAEFFDECQTRHPLQILRLQAKALQALNLVAHELTDTDLCVEPTEAPTPETRPGAFRLSSRKRRLLYTARNYIQENCAKPLDVAHIGRAVGIGQGALKQGFQRIFGTSVYSFVLDCRIELATQMLAAGTLSIKDIAWRCGFAHTSHLARLFRRRYGVSPAAYRAR